MLLSNLFSQEGLPVYTDYLTDNYYLLHPSMAGISNCSSAKLTTRQQWFGIKDAPKLTTVSANGRIGETPSGIGGVLFSDSNGFHSQKGVYATYAHHLLLSRSELDLNMLSFGLSAGLIQYQLDETTFLADSPIDDPAIIGTILNESNFNIDLGFSYHYLDFYAHTTIKNVLNNSGINNDIQITSNLRRFLFSTGYVFGVYGSSWSFEPSLFYQYRDGSKESSLDINGKAYKAMDFGKLWTGVSYRNGLDKSDAANTNGELLSQLTVLLGIDYNQFTFAYNYTNQLNSQVFTGGGFHQLTLGYNFSCKAKRYSCKCPAVIN